MGSQTLILVMARGEEGGGGGREEKSSFDVRECLCNM